MDVRLTSLTNLNLMTYSLVIHGADQDEVIATYPNKHQAELAQSTYNGFPHITQKAWIQENI